MMLLCCCVFICLFCLLSCCSFDFTFIVFIARIIWDTVYVYFPRFTHTHTPALVYNKNTLSMWKADAYDSILLRFVLFDQQSQVFRAIDVHMHISFLLESSIISFLKLYAFSVLMCPKYHFMCSCQCTFFQLFLINHEIKCSEESKI